MSEEYYDIQCGDDLDPYGRDVAPLEALAQDLYHWVDTEPGTLLLDPEWGFGIEQYLGAPLPSTLASDIAEGIRRDFEDRVRDAEVKIKAIPGEQDAYSLDIKAEVADDFLVLALKLTPDGIARVS